MSVLCIISRPGVFSPDFECYLSAVRFYSYGKGDPNIKGIATLEQLLKGIKSIRAKKSGTNRERLPITPALLRKIKAVLSKADD